MRLKSTRSFQHEEHLRAIRLYSIGVYYSLDVVLLLATGILPEKEPVHFHFMHNVKAAEPESIRQPAQRRRKKRQRPDFDAPVFRLSALARVIRTQAAKKKGRKIDVDPAFPPSLCRLPNRLRLCGLHVVHDKVRLRADVLRVGMSGCFSGARAVFAA